MLIKIVIQDLTHKKYSFISPIVLNENILKYVNKKVYSKEKIMETLETLGIVSSKRPHEIDTTDYHRLLKLL